ncbi:Calcium-activated potassium channel slowpoke [Eumeta japonica]|uniref:Calcium-activated potassium channel slowpoke n=1 Tax=Eumeta variegata TaxID=151549 RepID=A0A4C1TY07_EUMVA|nr:Calcium-activated potassium channel slowpoke [Eumeta japonica]
MFYLVKLTDEFKRERKGRARSRGARSDLLTADFRKEPDLELEGLLKRHYTTVEFFQGTMMNAVDLERVKGRTVPRSLTAPSRQETARPGARGPLQAALYYCGILSRHHYESDRPPARESKYRRGASRGAGCAAPAVPPCPASARARARVPSAVCPRCRVARACSPCVSLSY